jgi:hypothetical protein
VTDAEIDALICELHLAEAQQQQMTDLLVARAVAEAELAETNAALARARNELAEAQLGLIPHSQFKFIADLEEKIFLARQELPSLALRTCRAQEELSAINSKIAEASQRHDLLMDAFEEARQSINNPTEGENDG